jgi:hypothetical protein
MNASLFTIGYFSRSTFHGTEEQHRIQIQAILNASRRNNKERGITGALLFSEGCFAQVLEGPQESVEAVMEEIVCDPRHTDITILYTQETEARSFPNWSMAYAGEVHQSRELTAGNGALNSLDEIEMDERGETFLSVLRTHLRRG